MFYNQRNRSRKTIKKNEIVMQNKISKEKSDFSSEKKLSDEKMRCFHAVKILLELFELFSGR